MAWHVWWWWLVLVRLHNLPDCLPACGLSDALLSSVTHRRVQRYTCLPSTYLPHAAITHSCYSTDWSVRPFMLLYYIVCGWFYSLPTPTLRARMRAFMLWIDVAAAYADMNKTGKTPTWPSPLPSLLHTPTLYHLPPLFSMFLFILLCMPCLLLLYSSCPLPQTIRFRHVLFGFCIVVYCTCLYLMDRTEGRKEGGLCAQALPLFVILPQMVCNYPQRQVHGSSNPNAMGGGVVLKSCCCCIVSMTNSCLFLL